MNGLLLTDEQREYVRRHINDRPRTEVARKAGIGITTLYRLVRCYGGELMYSRAKRNPEWERLVRQHYATMSGHEIERRFGISENRANKIAHDLGLTHDAATTLRLRQKSAECLAEGRKNMDYQKRTAKWKRRRRMDELRLWEGKPQRTHHRFAQTPKRTYKAKWHLAQHYGYLTVDDQPFTMMYTADTRRLPANGKGKAWGTEAYYTRRYKLEFKEQTRNIDITK